jgi:hypothetical protein
VEEKPRPATAKVANLILDTEAEAEDEANEFLIEEAPRQVLTFTPGRIFMLRVRCMSTGGLGGGGLSGGQRTGLSSFVMKFVPN